MRNPATQQYRLSLSLFTSSLSHFTSRLPSQRLFASRLLPLSQGQGKRKKGINSVSECCLKHISLRLSLSLCVRFGEGKITYLMEESEESEELSEIEEENHVKPGEKHLSPCSGETTSPQSEITM
ncbi:unnamed protein product [Leuciscus chuanchicus]